jgi:hypothetical protein
MFQALDIFSNGALSMAFWLAVLMVMLYFARRPAHKAILSASLVIRNGLRLTARSLLLAERGLVSRNREVLLSSGADAAEKELEREFHRVDAVVRRDVSAFPSLQRKLADQIGRLDEDYRESSELPPPPPGWVHAVEAVAKLSGKSDAPVASILEEIHKSTTAQYRNTMDEYRKAVEKRHGLLDKMAPCWRGLSTALEDMGKRITSLQERSLIIDRDMDRYEEIRKGTSKAERVLTSSALTQFFISALVLAIAIGGAVINFNLIALPMSEMVGGNSYIGDFKTSDVAALVIILVEVAMGLYLMESLRITRLFPVIGQMDDRMRGRMVWVTFSILLILAGIESSLAFMRDRIAADMQALRQVLANVEATGAAKSKIPTIGQMVMGFILPFALTFVAIPLESFVHASRTVLGAALALLLRWSAFMLRLLGNVAQFLGEFLVNVYDLFIFLPLWAETKLRGESELDDVRPRRRTPRRTKAEAAPTAAAEEPAGMGLSDRLVEPESAEQEDEEMVSREVLS